MPYEKLSDLPDHVKKLPEDKQKQWMSVFNSVYKEKNDEGAAMAAANAAVKKNNEKTEYEFNAEIFSTGNWNGDEYTLKDLNGIVEAFRALRSEIKPMLKLGAHKNKFDPALGWDEDLWVKGEKLFAKFKKVPKILHDAIKKGLYKRVSVELFPNYKGKSTKDLYTNISIHLYMFVVTKPGNFQMWG